MGIGNETMGIPRMPSLRVSCPCFSAGKASDGRPRSNQPKTINIFFGFFFVVNFCVGTGFLGVPYAFYYSGFLAAIPTLFCIAFISWTAATWELEVMARAQALEYFKKKSNPSSTTAADSDDSSDDEHEKESPAYSAEDDTSPLVRNHPCYDITIHRKFEVTELCEVFFNRWVKYLYLVIMTIYCFLAGWSYATVAGSAWATNIPFNSSVLDMCSEQSFQHVIIPNFIPCRNAYQLCLLIFAVVVTPLCILDLKEQAFIQMLLGVLRFVTIGAIVLYAVVKLIQGGNPCDRPTDQYGVNGIDVDSYWRNESKIDTFESVVVKFDPRGWFAAIPIFTYAFIIHQGLPSLTHPIKQKAALNWLLVAMFGIAVACYALLGITASLWFRKSVTETVTLNWADLTGSGNSPQLRALSYYLILFPSLDVSSAYPLIVHTIVNNIYMVLLGQDTSEKPKYRFDWVIRLLLKLIVAILPIAAALFISNLVYVLKYAGLFGFFICFFFPAALQLRSIFVVTRTFRPHLARKQPGDWTGLAGSEDINTTDTEGKGVERSPLLSLSDSTPEDCGSRLPPYSIYRTPYSFRVLSHWVTPIVFVSIGGLLFLLTIVSLGVHPQTVTCDSNVPPVNVSWEDRASWEL